MSYDLTDLRLLGAIADTGNLTQGAARVHLAPSSASHRLRLLEDSVATPLFHRHARGLRLTAAGEAMLRHARIVLAQIDQMQADLAPFAGGATSQVSLFANTNAINCFLPEDLADFLHDHPEIRVSLEEQPSPAIVRAVLGGQVDIGVVAIDHAVSGVELHAYRRDRLVFVLPPGHPLTGRKTLKFHEVAREPFVCLHAGSAIHAFTMEAASRLGIALDVRIQVRSFNAICRLVAAGAGIGMIPRSSAERGACVVDIDEPWAQRDLQLCVRHRAGLSPAAEALYAHLLNKATR